MTPRERQPTRRAGRLWLAATIERLRRSLFFVPLLFVLAGVVLGYALLTVDLGLNRREVSLPLILTSTVESARVVTATIATATVTVAGIAFSVSLLVVQLASSQYSPRVVHSLFRDPVNRRLIGVVVGTFSYCITVLRAIRSAVEAGSDPVIPNLSVAVATILGLAAILATVYFIDHNARSMEVGDILQRVTTDTLAYLEKAWEESDDGAGSRPSIEEPADEGFVVRFRSNGWLQYVDDDALFDLVDAGGTVRFESAAGRYAIAGSPLCTIWPRPPEPDDVAARARSAVHLGPTRTMQQDVAYGLRQLADVALKALSPGVNDPTTAQDAIFHMGAVLGEMLRREPPARVRTDHQGRCLVRPEAPTVDELVGLAFEEVRRAAAPHPAVCIYLLEVLALLREALGDEGLADRLQPLDDQAGLVLAAAEHERLIDSDRDQVRQAWERRFGSDT